MPIKYIFFDCDNTLTLTEDLVLDATEDLVNEVLEAKRVAKRFTLDEVLRDYFGQKFKTMLVHLNERFKLGLTAAEMKKWTSLEEERVIDIIQAKAEPCAGSMEVLEKLHREGHYKLAVVSSSSLPRIRAALAKTGQQKFFAPDAVFSASSSLPVPKGKPAPDVYHHAVKALGAKHEECVAVEDSNSGADSARAAGIRLIGYVGAYLSCFERNTMIHQFGMRMDRVFTVMHHWNEFEKCLEVHVKDADSDAAVPAVS